MATSDTCCTIVPYFEVRSGHLDEFKSLCERFVATTEQEPDCLYYGFSFDGHNAHCREGYEPVAVVVDHRVASSEARAAQPAAGFRR